MTINIIDTIGWAGYIPVNPRVNTILTPEDLATITTAGWLKLDDPKVFPQHILPTDLWDIEYSYNPETGTQTYAKFATTISDGVITLTEVISSVGFVASNPALPTVASVTTGVYTVGNILAAADANGTVRAGNGIDITQSNTLTTATPNNFSLISSTTLTAAAITSGQASGGASRLSAVANTAGDLSAHTSSVTITGALGAASITSGNESIMNVGGNVMTAGAILAGYYVNVNAPSNVSGSTDNFCLLYGKGPQTGSLGSLISFNGKSATLINIVDGGPMVGTPGGLTPSGTLRSLFIEIGGVQFQIPCATILS